MEEGTLGSVGRPEYQSLAGLGFEATETAQTPEMHVECVAKCDWSHQCFHL